MQQAKLEIWERKVWRKIFSRKREGGRDMGEKIKPRTE